MSRTIPTLGVLAIALLLGSASLAPPGSHAQGPCICHKAVRVDYLLQGSTPSFTFCEIVNTSASSSIVLLNVYVMGSGGVNNILATYTGLNGQVVPPLGRARLDVSGSTIPGLSPQSGVANVAIGWSGGSMDSVKLTSNTVRYYTGNQENRTEVHYQGYEIVL